jgi:hypothetical protein
MTMHNLHRKTSRFAVRKPVRCLNRLCLRGRRRGPDDLSQALTAFGRAIRAHRRLARLAPSFFDSAVRDREALNHAERRRWMASWEPALARAYGVEPRPSTATVELPPLPSAQIQSEVDLKLAEREMCMTAGHAAMERYRQRQPHAVMSWSRMVRLLKIGFDFGNLACGLDSPNPLPEKIVYDYELTDLKRGYGLEPETLAVAVAALVPVAPSAAGGASVPASRPPDADMVSAAGGTDDGSPQGLPANRSTSSDSDESGGSPQGARCDAWSRWARTMRRMRS